MASSIPKTKPWHSQSKLAAALRVAWRLRLVPIFIVVFVLILFAIFANVWSNWRGLDPEVGTLQDRLVPPAWINAKVESLRGGMNFDNIEVYKNGELVRGAQITHQGSPIDANNEPVLGTVEFRSGGDVIKIGRALVYPGGVERENMSKLARGLVVVRNPVSFDGGGLYVNGEEVRSGVAFMGADNGGEVTFTPMGPTIQGRQAKDALEVTNASGNVVEPVVGIATMEVISIDGTEDEILAQPNAVRQLTPQGSSKYLLGTDKLGRDLVTGMIHGARTSLAVFLIVILLAGVTGTAVGLLAGYVGGWIDGLMMRLMDIYLLILAILLALGFLQYFGPSSWPLLGLSLRPPVEQSPWWPVEPSWWPSPGPSLWPYVGLSLPKVAMGIALVFWPLYARQVRGVVLSVKNRDLVRRIPAPDASQVRIIFMQIFPKLLYAFVIVAALQLGTTILLEAFLSYLGLGIPRPTPDWGSMMAGGRELIVSYRWISSLPALAILVVALSLFSLGEWTRNKLVSKIKVGSIN